MLLGTVDGCVNSMAAYDRAISALGLSQLSVAPLGPPPPLAVAQQISSNVVVNLVPLYLSQSRWRCPTPGTEWQVEAEAPSSTAPRGAPTRVDNPGVPNMLSCFVS